MKDGEKIKILGAQISFSDFKKFVVIFLIMIIAPVLFIHIFGYQDMNKTGGIGDTFNGLTAPFLALLSSVLVYLALNAQIEANRIISDQFEKQQNDQLFDRMIDRLHMRIINYSINPSMAQTTLLPSQGYGILQYLVEQFRFKMKEECKEFGRILMAKNPEIIGRLYYIKMLQAISDPQCTDMSYVEEVRNEIINNEDRWDFIKRYFNSRGHESEAQKQALVAIGSVYFYKTPFNTRYEHYSNAYCDLFNRHGGFLDGYMNNVKYILKFIDNSKDIGDYANYFVNNLSFQEKTLIFYFTSQTADKEFKLLVQKYRVLDNLYLNNSFFIDVPSKSEFENELNEIFDYDAPTVHL